MYKHLKKLGLEVRKRWKEKRSSLQCWRLVKGARQQQTGDGSESPLIGVLILTVGRVHKCRQQLTGVAVNWRLFTGWIVYWTVHWSGKLTGMD
eukprot:2067528-Amphidinium_carterae.1